MSNFDETLIKLANSQLLFDTEKIPDLPLRFQRENLTAEYGSVGNVKFANSDCVRLEDKEGAEIFCACGKPVVFTMVGTTACLCLCQECFDKKLNQSLCICGKPVISTIISKNAFLSLCQECYEKRLMEEVDER